jgi:hypothetical protein
MLRPLIAIPFPGIAEGSGTRIGYLTGAAKQYYALTFDI